MPMRSTLRLTKRIVDGLTGVNKDAVFWNRDPAGFGGRAQQWHPERVAPCTNTVSPSSIKPFGWYRISLKSDLSRPGLASYMLSGKHRKLNRTGFVGGSNS